MQDSDLVWCEVIGGGMAGIAAVQRGCLLVWKVREGAHTEICNREEAPSPAGPPVATQQKVTQRGQGQEEEVRRLYHTQESKLFN